MPTTPIPRRALALAVPTAVLTTVATAIAALPAHAEATAERPALTLHPSASPLRAVRTHTAAAVGSYTVEPGDTLWDIATEFGTTVGALISANGLRRDAVLQPGQVLQLSAAAPDPVPAAAPAAPADTAYTVTAGDTLWAIAAVHGTTVAALSAANGLGPDAIIYPGQTLRVGGSAAPAAAPTPAPAAVSTTAGTCTVAAGDTLWAIAAAHGTTIADLYAANGLGPGSIIYPGQTLLLAPVPAPAPPAPAAIDTYTAPQVTLSAEQAANAQRIIRIGRSLGVPDRGIAIALATAMVESGLTNEPGGDRDSVGLFQQRPSMGWGTKEQVSDPDYAIRTFFLGTPSANGLLDIAGWQGLDFSTAAQKVQISDYPARYGLWEPQATAWIAQLG